MTNEVTNIVIIDDLLNDNDLIVRQIRYNYKSVILLKSVKEGIDYLENNLDKRSIVLLDYQFSKQEPKGDYILEKLREKTMLIPVILMTVNVEMIDDYIKLINNKVFSIIDNKNDYKLILKNIFEAEQSLEIDNALQEWIIQHPKSEMDKPVYLSSGKKSYTLNEILKEMRMQTEVGKDFSKRLTKLTIDLLMRNKENLND